MRNFLLVAAREYRVRVRTRSFLLFTILMPLFAAGVVVLPGLLMMQQSSAKRVAVVSADLQLGRAIRSELNASRLEAADAQLAMENGTGVPRMEFDVRLAGAPSESLRRKLMESLQQGELDGVVWLDAKAASGRTATFYCRSAGDLVTGAWISRALRLALGQRQLARHGFSPEQAKELLGPVSLDTVRIDHRGARRSAGMDAFLLPFVLLFAIYMSVLIYGIYVMRSVIEEKTSRIVEVLLGSITPTQLLAGKIVGVGAVGLTQMILWAALGWLVGGSGYAVVRRVVGNAMQDANLSQAVLLMFPLFFVLGYATYACLYAAIGAMVNSDEEASQCQLPVTLPLLLCIVFASSVIGEPNSQLAFWLSMFPLTSPIIMFLRISVSMPPTWQIGLSIALSLTSLYLLVWLSARIYRVGILMYGKRPSLAELRKWLHYA